MLIKVRSYRPSHAVVVAYLALFVALGGSSYAAIKVTGKNVKDGSLTGKDIKNSSLAGGDIKDSSLGQRDFKRGELPAGRQGLTGPQGAAGAPGSAVAFTRVTKDGALVPGASKNVNSVVTIEGSAHCFDLAVPVRNAQATVDASASGDEFAQVAVPGRGCPAGNDDASVLTYNSDGHGSKAAFFVSFN